MRLVLLTLLMLILLVPAAPALAGGPCVVTTEIVDGRKFKADICLPNPGGGANYEMSFDLEFHVDPDNPLSLQNLTVPCVGFSVAVLDAAGLADVQSRLPDPINQAVDPALPLKITIEPPVACGLAFEDDYDVDFDATNLTYVPFSPYRLMKAPVGGGYADITAAVSAGSVRARGCGGTFSEFVLVTTAVQNYSAELVAGYAQLQAQIASAAIGPTAAATLDSDRAVSQAAFNVADYAEAILRLDDLLDHCGVLGGPVLPNRWRSARDLDNLEGEIVAQSAHLKFLLGRLNGVP